MGVMTSKKLHIFISYENSCVFSHLLVTAPFAFCVITFEAIEVQTCSAPQNDPLNLSFVKDTAENWLEMVEKRPFIIS